MKLLIVGLGSMGKRRARLAKGTENRFAFTAAQRAARDAKREGTP